MKSDTEILAQLKDSLHVVADTVDWQLHHSFGVDNHPKVNTHDEAYWAGFKDGAYSLAHNLLIQVCTANASTR